MYVLSTLISQPFPPILPHSPNCPMGREERTATTNIPLSRRYCHIPFPTGICTEHEFIGVNYYLTRDAEMVSKKS